MPKKKTLYEIVAKAQEAWRALELGQTSQADKQRCWDVLKGLTALDDDQAQIKGAIEELIIEFWNPNAPDADANVLLRRLIPLVSESAIRRDPEDQKAFDFIVEQLNPKEDKTCLKERPTRPARKAASRRPTSK